jgi:hypothetical protein
MANSGVHCIHCGGRAAARCLALPPVYSVAAQKLRNSSRPRRDDVVCVGQFFYDSWGACKQKPEFEPPLLCLFEPVWGCTSSALVAAANSSIAVGGGGASAPIQELTSFDSSAYEVFDVELLFTSSIYLILFSGCAPPQGTGLFLAAGAAFIVNHPPTSQRIRTASHALLLLPPGTSCAPAPLCIANWLLSKSH